MTPPRTPRDTRTLAEIGRDRFNRTIRIGLISVAVFLCGWFLVIGHFVVKYW